MSDRTNTSPVPQEQTTQQQAAAPDANTAAPTGDFSGTIDWGHGTASQFGSGAVSGSGGSYTVGASHQYAAQGVYSVMVVVNDSGGSSATDSGTLTVTAAGPSSITATGGNNQNTPTGSTFASPLQATVADNNGNPLSGVSVTFTAPASGVFSNGSTSITVATNASGVASATFTANSLAGSYSVKAAVSGVSTPASFSLTNTLVPAAIKVSAGSGQKTTVDAAFGTALQAKVTAANGNAVVGVSVTFTAPTSGASGVFSNGMTTITVATNATGVASATFRANTVAGSYSVTATVPGVAAPASFTLTNKAGAPATITVTGGNIQNTPIGSAFASPLQVTVADKYGNPVSGVNVTFKAPTSGAGGKFRNGKTHITVTTNASGVASATFTANRVAGSYSVTATVSGVAAPAAFSLTNNPPAAITITGGNNQSAPIGSAFANPLQVTVTDQYGNPVSGVTVTFTAPASGASGKFSKGKTSVTVTTNAAGVASVKFTANKITGAYEVKASFSYDGVPYFDLFTLTNS